ncbi:glycosyltransferase family A protein [Paraburkholderia fungorum]|uniref:glycosyltransferase family 2 protein n=1 Tax=Paraburkholderia fungorum TaxID=134537 RepID=UPI0038B6EDE7
MQSTRPVISVIIPTHRRPVLLERALHSIKSQVSPISYEIIVVADEWNPADDEVCQRLLGPDDIKIKRNGPPSRAQSRNLGLELASGKYAMFLDDEDAWQPGLLARLAERSEIREGRFVYFDCAVVTESRVTPQPQLISKTKVDLSAQLNELVYVKNQVDVSCFAFPRQLIDRIRFDSHMRAYEEWDFMLSVFDREMPVHLPVQGSIIHQASDDSSNQRDDSEGASSLHTVLDYLYVYHRHPAPSNAVREHRAALMQQVSVTLPADLL